MSEKISRAPSPDSGVVRRGHPLNSVTPDLDSRIGRAQEITQAVEEIQERSGVVEKGASHDPFQTAEDLGIYDRLGVTREQVESASHGGHTASGDTPNDRSEPTPTR